MPWPRDALEVVARGDGGVVDDLHAAAAEHEARAHQHRVADLLGDARRRRRRRSRCRCAGASRPGGVEDAARTARAPRPGRSPRASCRGSGRRPPRGPSRARAAVWPPSCTTTPTSSPRLRLGVDDLEHVLERQRLEVEPVAGVVVGRDRLGVAVDHDRLEPGVVQRERRVHARVVELDALADAVRAGAEDDDLALVARLHLGLEVVARVVVRRERRELARARVDRLVDRADAEDVAHLAHLRLAEAAQLARSARRRSRGPSRSAGCRRRASARARDLSATSLISTIWSRNHGSILVASNTCSTVAPRRSACCTSTMRPSVGRRDRLEQLVHGARLGAPVEARAALLERAQRLLQRARVVAADRHRLADRLHGRGEGRVGGRELLEREPRHLHDDVVERRLEARRRDLGDVVRDLVEAVADRELRGDLRDREAGRLRGERRRARDARVHLDDDDRGRSPGRPRTGCCSRRCRRRRRG